MPKDKTKIKLQIIRYVALTLIITGIGIFTWGYIKGSDPLVKECFNLAEQIEQLANQSGGITSEVAIEYDKFLVKCSHMLDMEEQIRKNPELHSGIRIGS